jgi:hypothetical protein
LIFGLPVPTLNAAEEETKIGLVEVRSLTPDHCAHVLLGAEDAESLIDVLEVEQVLVSEYQNRAFDRFAEKIVRQREEIRVYEDDVGDF